MSMLQNKSAYDLPMSVASSSAMPAYSSMAAYTPQMPGPMHTAMHPHMYTGMQMFCHKIIVLYIVIPGYNAAVMLLKQSNQELSGTFFRVHVNQHDWFNFRLLWTFGIIKGILCCMTTVLQFELPFFLVFSRQFHNYNWYD